MRLLFELECDLGVTCVVVMEFESGLDETKAVDGVLLSCSGCGDFE